MVGSTRHKPQSPQGTFPFVPGGTGARRGPGGPRTGVAQGVVGDRRVVDNCRSPAGSGERACAGSRRGGSPRLGAGGVAGGRPLGDSAGASGPRARRARAGCRGWRTDGGPPPFHLFPSPVRPRRAGGAGREKWGTPLRRASGLQSRLGLRTPLPCPLLASGRHWGSPA